MSNGIKTAFEKIFRSLLTKVSDDDLDWFRTTLANVTRQETISRMQEKAARE